MTARATGPASASEESICQRIIRHAGGRIGKNTVTHAATAASGATAISALSAITAISAGSATEDTGSSTGSTFATFARQAADSASSAVAAAAEIKNCLLDRRCEAAVNKHADG